MTYYIIFVVMEMEEQKNKIISVINELKPYLIMDGGNVEFVDYKDNIVYIRLQGACANCGMLDLTLKDGIEAAIIEEVPEVLSVVNVG